MLLFEEKSGFSGKTLAFRRDGFVFHLCLAVLLPAAATAWIAYYREVQSERVVIAIFLILFGVCLVDLLLRHFLCRLKGTPGGGLAYRSFGRIALFPFQGPWKEEGRESAQIANGIIELKSGASFRPYGALRTRTG